MDIAFWAAVAKVAKKILQVLLGDENGRKFTVRRYLGAKGECRFEVYNCVDLISTGEKNAGKLLDLTLVQEKKLAVESAENTEAQKRIYTAYTSGHFNRGVE